MTRRDWTVVAAAGVLHLLWLCVPILLLGDVRRIGGDPALAIFLSLAGSWCFFESIASANRARPTTGTSGPRWLAPTIGLAVLATFWVSVVDTVLCMPSRIGAVTGAVLMTAGIALRCLSIRTLGPYFLNEVSLLPGQPLVTDGLRRDSYYTLRDLADPAGRRRVAPSLLGCICPLCPRRARIYSPDSPLRLQPVFGRLCHQLMRIPRRVRLRPQSATRFPARPNRPEKRSRRAIWDG